MPALTELSGGEVDDICQVVRNIEKIMRQGKDRAAATIYSIFVQISKTSLPESTLLPENVLIHLQIFDDCDVNNAPGVVQCTS